MPLMTRARQGAANFGPWENIVRILILTWFMLYVTSLGIYIAEHDAQPEKFRSFFDALWFAEETLSTVGYGDLVPITPMGRIFTGVIMFIAVSIIAISTGLITSAFSHVWQQENIFAHSHRQPANKVLAEAGREDDESK